MSSISGLQIMIPPSALSAPPSSAVSPNHVGVSFSTIASQSLDFSKQPGLSASPSAPSSTKSTMIPVVLMSSQGAKNAICPEPAVEQN